MFLAGVIGELSAYGNAADGRDLLMMNHEIAKASPTRTGSEAAPRRYSVARGVVLDVPYVGADLEGFHLVGGERAQEVNRRPGGVGVAFEPAVEVSGVEDDGHAVVD
jgi:hypothetical protein